MTDEPTVATKQVAIDLTKRVFAEYEGRIIRVPYVIGMVNSESTEFYAPEGQYIRVRVLPTREEDLIRFLDRNIIDPYWDVEVMDPESLGIEREVWTWIDGPSIKIAGIE